jgi:hypothetical protein
MVNGATAQQIYLFIALMDFHETSSDDTSVNSALNH